MGVSGKLFKNGGSQAVRIPAEFRFEGTEVDFRPGPVPGEVIMAPKHRRTGNLNAFFAARDLIPDHELEGFMENREQGEHERDDPLA